jgi:transposase-like protein
MQERTKAETEEFYRQVLADQSKSDLSLREFASKRGIPAGTLSFWRHELKRRDAERGKRKSKKKAREAKPKFLPVSVVTSPDPPAIEPRPAGVSKQAREGYEIVLGPDRVLRLPADFDGARVAALVRAVASC